MSPASTPPRPAATTKAAADAPEVRARVGEGMALVPMVARQMARSLGGSLDVSELESMAREGLLDAARGFDDDRGVPFRRWANLRMRGAILDGVRRQGSVPRRVYRRLRAIEAGDRVHDALLEEDAAAPAPTPEAADARIDAYLSGIAVAAAAAFLTPETEGIEEVPAVDEPSPESRTARAELVARLRVAIDERPDAERALLRRHYVDGATFEEAAREIGLSKSWASRLHARAIDAIAKKLRNELTREEIAQRRERGGR